MGATAHHHPATPGAITFLDPDQTINKGSGGEIRRRHQIDQLFNIHVRRLQQRHAGIHHLAQIVRRNIGGHADGNPGGAIHQQIGETRGQHQRLLLRAIVVGAKIDGFLVEVRHQLMRNARHADFGITHRSGVVAIHRAEVPLPIHQRVAQRKRLRHAHDGVVHSGVTMRVIFTDHVTNDTRGLLVSTIPIVVQLAHGKQHTAMHRLQTVAHIRQGTPDDDAHGIVQIGLAHLFFQADREGFFRELIHHV